MAIKVSFKNHLEWLCLFELFPICRHFSCLFCLSSKIIDRHNKASNRHIRAQSFTNTSKLPKNAESSRFIAVEKRRISGMDIGASANE